MNKIKNLFVKPLITSSSSKISPVVHEESHPSSRRKHKETVPPKKPAEEETYFNTLSRSRTFTSPTKTKKPRPKKHSLPLDLRRHKKKTFVFNFEQFEELVDTNKFKHRREIPNQEDEEEEEVGTTKSRRHSWSSAERSNIKFNYELFKKPQPAPVLFISPPQSGNTTVVPSPNVRSPMNLSKAEESANLLLEGGESMRKDLPLSGIGSWDDSKLKEATDKLGGDDSMQVNGRGMLFQSIGGKEVEEKRAFTFQEINKEEDKGQTENTENKNENSKKQKIGQKNMFQKLSAKLIQASKLGRLVKKEQPPAHDVGDSQSSQSEVDSLVEDNPFEDERNVIRTNASLRKKRNRLRDDERYAFVTWILFPDDPARKGWDLMIFVALLYTALLMPVRVTFLADQDNDEAWVVFEWFFDAVFVVDIFVTMFSAFFDNEDNLVYEKKKIIWSYLTGWFALDLLSIIPFHLINDVDDDKQRLNNLVRVARLPRLYRLVKIIKLVRMVKVVKDRTKFQTYMNKLFKLGPAYERLAVSVVGIFIFCHVSACIWFLLVGLGDSPNNWLSGHGIDFLHKFDQYMASFYLVVQTVVTVGYGDLSPSTPEERLLACFLMMIGVLSYSIFIGFVSSLINDVEVMNAKYNQKLQTLQRLTKEYSLSVFFTKKLTRAIKYENKQTMDNQHFLKDLPTNLAIEVACIMHKDITKSIAFFANRPKAFIASICPLLKPIAINKNDTIFMEGDPADEIFFIKTGTIGYVLPDQKNECFLKVREGYFFGEIDLLFYGEIRKYTAMALKDCELYVLNKKDFKQVFLNDHRDIGRALYENACLRKQRTRKAYKEALHACKNTNDSATDKKRRFHIMKKDRFSAPKSPSENSSDSDKQDDPLLKIVEEEEEEDEDGKHTGGHKTAPKLPEVTKPEQKPATGFAHLKAAMILKRSLNAKRTIAKAFAQSKEEAKFAEVNRKIDSLENKIAQLVALGQSMRKGSGKGPASPALSSGKGPLSPAPGKRILSPVPSSQAKPQQQMTLLSRILMHNQVNKQKPNQIESKSSGENLGSPTNSDSSMNSMRSPNTLRRALLAKKQMDMEDSVIKAPLSNRKLELTPRSPELPSETDRMKTLSIADTQKYTFATGSFGDFEGSEGNQGNLRERIESKDMDESKGGSMQMFRDDSEEKSRFMRSPHRVFSHFAKTSARKSEDKSIAMSNQPEVEDL